MSAHLTYSAEGFRRLVIGELASDAKLSGAADSRDIVISYNGDASAAPAFVAEGETLRWQGAAAERVLVPAHLSVTVEDAAGELRVQNLAGNLELPAILGDLRLRSLGAWVSVPQVNGDVRAESVIGLRLGQCNGDVQFVEGGTLDCEGIAGDLRLGNVHSATVGRVRGDMWAERVVDTLQVGRVDGEARLRGVAGMVRFEYISGDLRADELPGGLAVGNVSGDVVLHGPYGAGQSYQITNEGDVALHLPPDADVRLTLTASGRIRADVPLTPSPDGRPTFSGRVGQGSARLQVQSSGDVRVNQAGGKQGHAHNYSGFGELGERIRQQVMASLEGAGINVDFGEGIWGPGRSARRSGAQHEPPRPPAVAHMPGAGAGGRTETPPAPSREEQLAILQMLESGSITAVEADALLKALGG